MIRRVPRRPSGSFAGSSGALPGHQTATGESGSSSGSTTEAGCLVTSPESRICARSPETPEPMPTWASTRGAPRRSPKTTLRMREGCSREADRATAIASSEVFSSATMTRVMTMPMAGLPDRRRARMNSAAISPEWVSVSSIISGCLRSRERSE